MKIIHQPGHVAWRFSLLLRGKVIYPSHDAYPALYSWSGFGILVTHEPFVRTTDEVAVLADAAEQQGFAEAFEEFAHGREIPQMSKAERIRQLLRLRSR